MYGSPQAATLSWFAAINHKDGAAAVAHFTHAAAGMMGWGNGNTASWPTFSALRCRRLSRTATNAVVSCTFSESRAPSVGNPVNFWTVSLTLKPGGRWLITNYGQG